MSTLTIYHSNYKLSLIYSKFVVDNYLMSAYSELNDKELTTLLREDDRAAFAEIYKRYWKKMLLIAWNHTIDKAHAEDVVHEVFISFWEKRNDVEIQSVPAFLTTCIKFTIFKYYQRKQRREQLAIKNYLFTDITNDEEELDALFLKEYLNGIIEQLPEKCRLTFLYSRVEGLNNTEIAERMDISDKGVEANLTRSLKILRKSLKGSGLLILVSASLLKDLFIKI